MKIRDGLAFAALEWGIFQKLLDANRTTIDRAGSGFFQVIGMALQRDVVLALARLTDPPSTGSHANISLRALLETLPSTMDSRLVAELTARLDAQTMSSSFGNSE